MENKENENMEQWKDVNKKSPAGTIVIIILLLVIAGLGFFIYQNKDKLFGEKEKQQQQEQQEEKEEEPITFTNEELEQYIKYISPFSYGPAQKIYGVDKVVASELSAREKIEYIANYLRIDKLISDEHTFPSNNRFLETDVKEYVEKVYGPGTYEVTTFNLGCADYNLADDGYYREAPHNGCGGMGGSSAFHVIINYKATKNRLEITSAYAFRDNYKKIHKDIAYTNGIVYNDEIGSDDGDWADSQTFMTNFINEHKDELNHLVYVFESTDGKNYYFKELTNVRK